MKNYLIFFFFLFLFLIFVWQGIFLPKDISSFEEKSFLIKKGKNVFQIAKNLENENLIKNQFYFEIYLIFKNQFGKLKAGEYLLSPSMTIPEIAQKIVAGNVMKKKITIIEGWNLRDINWYLENRGLFQTEDLFETAKKDFSNDFDFLKDKPRTIMVQGKPKNVSLEGYLFPDTYEINKGATIEEVVRKMLQNFDKKLKPELREETNRHGKTIFGIVTMASMLEKEVKGFEDKKLVSGILWKRLENGIPLQVDATIAYITGENTTGISIDDTKIDSPYNTYKYKGLPVGPISNPGLDSILAAIYPEESNYWYYLSTPDGKTIFSKTLQEHNIAKAKYLK